MICLRNCSVVRWCRRRPTSGHRGQGEPTNTNRLSESPFPVRRRSSRSGARRSRLVGQLARRRLGPARRPGRRALRPHPDGFDATEPGEAFELVSDRDPTPVRSFLASLSSTATDPADVTPFEVERATPRRVHSNSL
ncbi:hypothetical protein BRD06_10775 [Halobacteriales archaeon QS_9_67_15]|nr:MAG: hypothetical protein BRD06_10775 [Halobacteriales archaeon QS_9_67_15]